jgi:hypothetical protein
MILYPSTSLHQVTPVTRGTRLCSFFWLQSMIRDGGQRGLLYDMDVAIQASAAHTPRTPPRSNSPASTTTSSANGPRCSRSMSVSAASISDLNARRELGVAWMNRGHSQLLLDNPTGDARGAGRL